MRKRILFFQNDEKSSLNKEENLKEAVEKGEYQRIENENKVVTFRGYFGENSYSLFKACTDDLKYKIIYVPGFGESYPGENIYNAIINALYNEIENNGFGKNFSKIYSDYKKDDELSIINEMLSFVKMILKNPQLIFLIDMQYYAIEYENFERLSKLKEEFAIVSTATVEEQIEYFPSREVFFESFFNLQPE